MNGHSKMNYSGILQESGLAFQNVFQEHPTESHNTQETLQIGSNCGLRKSMAFFHNITPFASATHLNTVDITFYNSTNLMHKMNCPKAKKPKTKPENSHTLETLILTQNLVSVHGERGHLHINYPL